MAKDIDKTLDTFLGKDSKKSKKTEVSQITKEKIKTTNEVVELTQKTLIVEDGRQLLL